MAHVKVGLTKMRFGLMIVVIQEMGQSWERLGRRLLRTIHKLGSLGPRGPLCSQAVNVFLKLYKLLQVVAADWIDLYWCKLDSRLQPRRRPEAPRSRWLGPPVRE